MCCQAMCLLAILSYQVDKLVSALKCPRGLGRYHHDLCIDPIYIEGSGQCPRGELQSWVGKGAMSFVPYLGISDVSKLAILHVMDCMSNVHVSNCLYFFGFSMPSLTVISFS